jgi:hypothetical protein
MQGLRRVTLVVQQSRRAIDTCLGHLSAVMDMFFQSRFCLKNTYSRSIDIWVAKSTHLLLPPERYVTRSVTYLICNISCLTTSRVPKNARSKRALDARAPKEVEDERTAIFVRGSHTGEVLNGVMKDLVHISLHFFFSHSI